MPKTLWVPPKSALIEAGWGIVFLDQWVFLGLKKEQESTTHRGPTGGTHRGPTAGRQPRYFQLFPGGLRGAHEGGLCGAVLGPGVWLVFEASEKWGWNPQLVGKREPTSMIGQHEIEMRLSEVGEHLREQSFALPEGVVWLLPSEGCGGPGALVGSFLCLWLGKMTQGETSSLFISHAASRYLEQRKWDGQIFLFMCWIQLHPLCVACVEAYKPLQRGGHANALVRLVRLVSWFLHARPGAGVSCSDGHCEESWKDACASLHQVESR